jgi:uncharacterized protein with FMN-binding domain
MPKQMRRGLVALSGSTIAAVYLAGLVATRGATAEASSLTPVAAATSPAPATTGGVSLTVPSQMSTAAATTGAYADGTYRGTGNSRFGSISVSVTIQGGRIANVAITNSTTSFPVSRIASLPGKVVAQQSAQVNKVSGATYSSQAFTQAVQAALSQAWSA